MRKVYGDETSGVMVAFSQERIHIQSRSAQNATMVHTRPIQTSGVVASRIDAPRKAVGIRFDCDGGHVILRWSADCGADLRLDPHPRSTSARDPGKLVPDGGSLEGMAHHGSTGSDANVINR